MTGFDTLARHLMIGLVVIVAFAALPVFITPAWPISRFPFMATMAQMKNTTTSPSQ